MYKQKLIDLLKSDEQVKEAMEKLEFGCKWINIYNSKNIETICSNILWWNFYSLYKEEFWVKIHYPHISQIKEIIWLPLQERFIRMYCENKKINIAFSNTELWHLNWDVILPIICKLDNTKDFDNQSEEVYQKIYEALLKLNK